MRVNRLQQVNLMRLWAVHHNGEPNHPVASSSCHAPLVTSPGMKPHKDVIRSTIRNGVEHQKEKGCPVSFISFVNNLGAGGVDPQRLPADSSGSRLRHHPDPLDDATVAKIEAIIQQAMTVYPIPGFAMCIVKDGQVVYSKGFGFADLASKRPVTPQSLLLQASVTKSLVAMAILRLAEQGKIDLDEPVTTYLPYFTMADERYKAITVRMLLSHHTACRTRPPFGRNHLTLP